MVLSTAFGNDNGMTTLLLVLCAIAIMVVLLRRHQSRDTTHRDTARSQINRVRDQQRLHSSMDELLVQLEEVSRRVAAQVETKFAKLEKVVRDADDRIARLEGVLRRAGGEAALTHAAATSAPANPAEHTSGDDAIVDQQLPASLSDNSAQTVELTEPIEPTDTVELTEPVDPRFEHIYELADGGASPIEVAEQLELPVGEVELILNLRKLR